jgi:hypothetical protein
MTTTNLHIYNTLNEGEFKQYDLLIDKPIDDIDFKILLLIFCGVHQCTHLSAFLPITKQAIAKRAQLLEDRQLLDIRDQAIFNYRRAYHLTSISQKIIDDIMPDLSDFNAFQYFLKKLKLVDKQ